MIFIMFDNNIKTFSFARITLFFSILKKCFFRYFSGTRNFLHLFRDLKYFFRTHKIYRIFYEPQILNYIYPPNTLTNENYKLF